MTDRRLPPTSSLTCAQCDYPLRGVARDGACPECGTAVETAIAVRMLQIGGDAPRRDRRAAPVGRRLIVVLLVCALGGVGAVLWTLLR